MTSYCDVAIYHKMKIGIIITCAILALSFVVNVILIMSITWRGEPLVKDDTKKSKKD